MFKRYLTLLALIIAGWLIIHFLPKGREPFKESSILKRCQTSDPESRLACSLKIRLRSATRFDIELIDGISDTLAFRIYDRKSEILARAKTLPRPERYKAFEIVHGIGSKTARKLERLIELDQSYY